MCKEKSDCRKCGAEHVCGNKKFAKAGNEKRQLVLYLADYLQTEVLRCNGVFDCAVLREWLDDGVEAFESTTDQTISITPM